MRLARVALAMTLITACGVPLESAPETFDVEFDVPELIDQPRRQDLASVPVYLVRDDLVVEVTRDLSSPTSPIQILSSLFEGLTASEEQADLRTSIPSGTEIVEASQEGPILRLDLSRDFAAVGGEEEILAVAQIVLTATSIEGVDTVAFELAGIPTDVPVAGGALSVDPVGAGDYAELLGS